MMRHRKILSAALIGTVCLCIILTCGCSAPTSPSTGPGPAEVTPNPTEVEGGTIDSFPLMEKVDPSRLEAFLPQYGPLTPATGSGWYVDVKRSYYEPLHDLYDPCTPSYNCSSIAERSYQRSDEGSCEFDEMVVRIEDSPWEASRFLAQRRDGGYLNPLTNSYIGEPYRVGEVRGYPSAEIPYENDWRLETRVAVKGRILVTVTTDKGHTICAQGPAIASRDWHDFHVSSIDYDGLASLV